MGELRLACLIAGLALFITGHFVLGLALIIIAFIG